MANTFVAINHGVPGFSNTDFTIGSSSTASTDVEVRIASVDALGHPINWLDSIIALKAITRALENGLVLAVPQV